MNHVISTASKRSTRKRRRISSSGTRASPALGWRAAPLCMCTMLLTAASDGDADGGGNGDRSARPSAPSARRWSPSLGDLDRYSHRVVERRCSDRYSLSWYLGERNAAPRPPKPPRSSAETRLEMTWRIRMASLNH